MPAHAQGSSASQGPCVNESVLDEEVARIHLRLVLEQWRRLPVGTIACNAFIVWILMQAGLSTWALTWLAADSLLQFFRWRVAMRRPDERHSAVQQTRRLTWMFGALGLSRACLVPIVFSQPLSEMHYVYTMVTVGLSAGAVGAVGGLHQAYRWGVGLALLSTAAGWLVDGHRQGVVVAALLVLLWFVLSAFVRNYGGTLRQLASLADAANKASQSKTRFFAAAGHDLRQPLHALAVNAATLGRAARRVGDTSIIDASHGIDRALEQSNGLLDSLLEISRLDAQSIPVNIEPVDACALLDGISDAFQPIAIERGLRLVVDRDPAIDRSGSPGHDPATECWIDVDRELMTRILSNLVSNALKFTTEGEVILLIRPLDPLRPNGNVLIAVTDTGCGIEASEQGRVFEEFYQAGNRPRDHLQGLGLGLSIVERSCALMNIHVALHSQVGKGTRVELTVRSATPLEFDSLKNIDWQ
jgi:signal transduction histidine kinase